ncbi:MAG: hypothetical protein NVSMB32_01210 [Actinomycetota bacterium]
MVGKFKLGLMLGLSVGYVAGTASGRQRFDQMQAGAERVVHLGHKVAGSRLLRSAGEKVGVVGSGLKSKLTPSTDPPGPVSYPADEPPASSF